MKRILKRLIPPSLWQMAGATKDSIFRLPELPGAYLHPWRRGSIDALTAMHNSHRGERAVIVGNGPSLSKMDLSKLRGEYTFGMNRIYLLFPKLGFETTYYISVNDLVIGQCVDDILELAMPKFISWRSRKAFPSDLSQVTRELIFLYTTYTGAHFSHHAAGRLWEGATVTYVALQLAFHMGFEQVILIGVDHCFSSVGSANQVVTSDGDDPNHFHPNYFGKGFRWQLPDLATSERAYRMAKQVYEAHDRQILDATIDGKLAVFPKVDYCTIF